LKPAEQTPVSMLELMKVIGDLLPPGVLNVVNGFGVEAGKPLASSSRIRKIAFTGETTTGRLIMQYASQNLIPVTLELGGKSPNIFFADVMAENDDFQDKALEGFTMFALNQGEGVHLPRRGRSSTSRIYDEFLAAAVIRTKAVRQGNPLDTDTMIGAQGQQRPAGEDPRLRRDRQERRRAGGHRRRAGDLGGELSGGYYMQPTIFEGANDMRIFQEEIFGPVVSVTSFDGYDDAIAIANDTLYGLGSGVWTRDGSRAYRAGRDIQAGRVWTNCYHAYPAHAAFGGYKQSGIGRENHKMMLDHYQQTKKHAGQLHTQGAGLLLSHDHTSGRAGRDHPGGGCGAASPPGAARAADVPPVGRLLRTARRRCASPRSEFIVGDADVLLGVLRDGDAETPRVDLRIPVRVVEAHAAAAARRRRGPWRGLQRRSTGRGAVPDPQPGVRSGGAGVALGLPCSARSRSPRRRSRTSAVPA
jgi:hypothetical protein